MNKITIILRLSFIIILITMISVLVSKCSDYKEKYEIAKTNERTYVEQINGAKEEIGIYKLSLAQIKYVQDSTMQRITKVIDSLKLKDKNITNIQYLSTTIYKQDTITFEDTVFIEPDFCVDTIVGDGWVNTHLHLEYPSMITVEPTVNSEKICIVNLKKETINPPKKTWIGRLFQRKHKVAKVKIVESNPHMIEQENIFIEVVK